MSVLPKPSLKIRIANAICWNSLVLFRDYGLHHILFRNKTFLFFKIESWNFQHLFEKKSCEPSQNFNSIRQWIKIGNRKCLNELKFCEVSQNSFFKQMLKVSAFYLERQKSFIPKILFFLSRCQYQNKKALFTDPIFSEGFELNLFNRVALI